MSEPLQLEEIFWRASQLESQEERQQYVAQACAGDSELAERVFALLNAARDSGSFLEAPLLRSERQGETPERPRSSVRPAEFPFLAEPVLSGDLGAIAQYRILQCVGRGGMGIVFRAFDTKLHRIVAIKVLAPELALDPTARTRFERESRSAAAISHPHVVTVHAVDETYDPPYLVMEFVQGKTLADKLEAQGALALKEILRIGGQIAEGLAAAHRQGLVHRDVKPANVLLENGVERAKVTDFGLARAVTDLGMTRTGEISGTPAYMSPEQANGELIDHRSDLFSLGAVLYAMCTGGPPFRASNPVVVLKKICEDSPPPVRKLNPDMPVWLCDLIDHLLDKSTDKRIQSADEVAYALQNYLATLQAGDTIVPRNWDSRQRTIRNVRMARRSIVFTTILLAGIVFWIRWPSPDGTAISTHVANKGINSSSPLNSAAVPGLPELSQSQTNSAQQSQSPVQLPVISKQRLAYEQPEFHQWSVEVSRLPAEQQVAAVAKKLRELNADFDGITRHQIENSTVSALRFHSDFVTDISPVRALTSLKILECHGSEYGVVPVGGALSDLSPLRGTQLQQIDFNSTHVSDLSPLAGMPLQSLRFGFTAVSDLRPLKGMPLIDLRCPKTPVIDLTPLNGMQLSCLDIALTDVSDLSPTNGMPLTRLYCRGTKVADLTPLTSMPLSVLEIEGTPVFDLSPLQGMNLSHLRFQPRQVARGIDVLRSMKDLKVMINRNVLSTDEFFKVYDSGAFGKSEVPAK